MTVTARPPSLTMLMLFTSLALAGCGAPPTLPPIGGGVGGGGGSVGGLFLFLADDGVHGIEPWVTDGTPAGTRPLRAFCEGVDDWCGSDIFH